MAKNTSRARKVWIFKWLLKKHRCTVCLEKEFFKQDGKRVAFFRAVLLRQDGKVFKLIVSSNSNGTKSRASQMAVVVPCELDISYADVLDCIIETVEKNGGACWMVNAGWPPMDDCLFLREGVSLEELAIEFDMTWRDVFNCQPKDLKDKDGH